MLIKISRDFSSMPGARYRTDGPASGQAFLEEHLLPAFLRRSLHDYHVTVDLDDCEGFSSGFLEEAFGGLVRRLDRATVEDGLQFISTEDPSLEQEIRTFIREA